MTIARVCLAAIGLLVRLNLQRLERLASEQMEAVIGGLTPEKLSECIYVVADASRRPGSDIVAWYVAVAGGVSVVDALAKVRELGANYDRFGESFAVAQMVPLDLLPELLSAIGPGNADRVHGWLSATLPCANVRALLIAGSNVAFTLMPLKTFQA